MPFTAAHPAAVVYLQRLPWRLSGVALVAGSVAPDIEFYLRLRAHAIAVESLWIQLLIAFLICLVWQWNLRRICTELLPSVFVHRFGIAKPVPFIQAAVRDPGGHLLALLIGIYSHWIWDSFTHHDGSCVDWFPALASQWKVPLIETPIRIYFLLQILSSVLGIALVLWYRHKPAPEFGNSQISLPGRKDKLRTRLLFMLTWAVVWLISAGILPPSRFVWDDVFRLLGAAVYALLLISLLQGFAECLRLRHRGNAREF